MKVGGKLGGKKRRLLPTEHVHMASIYAGLAISMKEHRHCVLTENRINNDQNFGLRNGYVILTESGRTDSSNELSKPSRTRSKDNRRRHLCSYC